MINKITLSLSLVILCSTQFALAEIYKRIDSEGRITYSNVKTAGSVRLKIGNDDPVVKSRKSDSATEKPANSGLNSGASISTNTHDYAKISTQAQSSRDQTRKMILTSELESEKSALHQAEQAYQEAEVNPEVYKKRNADGSISTFRNVPKYQAKMGELRSAVESHQRNIQLLEKELGALN
jgi:hypothetical protein